MTRDAELDRLLAVARDAAGAATELLAGARPAEVRTKGNPRDLVTEWDLRSEALIRARLEAGAPGIAVVGEEEGGADAPDPVAGRSHRRHRQLRPRPAAVGGQHRARDRRRARGRRDRGAGAGLAVLVPARRRRLGRPRRRPDPARRQRDRAPRPGAAGHRLPLRPRDLAAEQLRPVGALPAHRRRLPPARRGRPRPRVRRPRRPRRLLGAPAQAVGPGGRRAAGRGGRRAGDRSAGRPVPGRRGSGGGVERCYS